MDLAGYLRYVAAFNSQDWDLVHSTYYATDILIDFPVARLAGADTSLEWFRASHRDTFETLVPKHIEVGEDGRRIVAQLDVQFILLRDAAASPLGPDGRHGDNFLVPMTATYHVNADERIDGLTVSFHEPFRIQWLAGQHGATDRATDATIAAS